MFDGKQVTSTFKYDKQYNEVAEEPADALKKEKAITASKLKWRQ